MSRFADPNAVERLSFGACQCPGTPHDEDWIDLRTQLGGEDAERIARGGSVDALLLLVTAWNFLDADGSEAPIDRAHLAALFGDQYATLNEWVSEHVQFATLPNASAAPSPRTSRGSGSRSTPTPRTGRSSTT